MLELLDVRSGARERVRRVAGGGLTGVNFSGPTWVGDGSLHWTEICAGDPQGCPRRHNYGSRSRTGRVTLAPAPLSTNAYTTTARAAWTLRNCPTFDLFPDPTAPQCQLIEETPPPLVAPGT